MINWLLNQSYSTGNECKRLGTKFVPASKQSNPPPQMDIESDGEEGKKFFTDPAEMMGTKGTSQAESDAESDDSFSDLYPGKSISNLRE